MFNILSILIGVIALLLALFGLIPFLGAVNWIAIPIALVGAAIGAMSSGKAGRNLNVLVLIVGVIRLILGHGIL